MNNLLSPGQVAASDPLLALYLEAGCDVAASRQLEALFSQHAAPLTQEILRAKQPDDFETADAASATREQLIRQLRLLRSGEREEPIRDFRAYVATVTYSAWAESLRARHPQRALLLNRLRYLLENKTTQKGFAIWPDGDGNKWCGFQPWSGRSGRESPKRHWLLVSPIAAAREALDGADPAGMILPELVSGLFRWLDGPIELRDLTAILVELPGVIQTEVASPNEALAAVDPCQSPSEELVWKEYLGWLWRELGQLSDRQRRAFLFHSDILPEFDFSGIASIRSIATALGLSAPDLAALWNQIPLEDLTIAKMLECTRQQVINLRRVARDNLSAAWKAWKVGAGNNGARSPS